MRLLGKTAIITGAASGMGRAVCHSLAREGARLGLLDRNEKGVHSLAGELQENGTTCACAVADVSRRADIESAIGSLAAQLGPVDILVASAGVLEMAAPEDLTVEHVEGIMGVNFFGTLYAIHAVLPDMLKRGQGQIVGMASLAASRGIPFEAAYGASKSALGNYLESIRPGLRQRGIAVTSIYPGFVETPLLQAAADQMVCQFFVSRTLRSIFSRRRLLGSVTAEYAAQKITSAILNRRRTACFPLSTRVLVRLAYTLPAPIYDWVMERITKNLGLTRKVEPLPGPAKLVEERIAS